MCWKTCLLAENTTNSPFFHNAPCLPPSPPPQKKYVTSVFDFSWGDCIMREKLETMVMQNFWRVNRVRYGLCENVNFSAPQPRPKG